MDPRYIDLARNLVSHSTSVKSGERVLIHSFDIPEEMTIALIRAVKEKEVSPLHKFNQLEWTGSPCWESPKSNLRLV